MLHLAPRSARPGALRAARAELAARPGRRDRRAGARSSASCCSARWARTRGRRSYVFFIEPSTRSTTSASCCSRPARSCCARSACPSAIARTSGTSAPRASSSWARSSAAASRSRSTTSESPLVLPAMLLAGMAGGMLWAAIPAFLRTRYNANEILVSLMLVYVASLVLSLLVHDAWRDPEGFNFPQSKMFTEQRAAAEPAAGNAAQRRPLHRAARRGARAGSSCARASPGYQMRVAGLAPAAANYAGISSRRTVWLGMLIGGACAGLAGRRRSRGTDRPAAADHLAGLRLRRDHRRVRRPPASGRHLLREPAHVAAVPGRRGGADEAGAAVVGDRPVPGHAAVLPARRRRLHPLSAACRAHDPRPPREPRDGSRRTARRPHPRRRHAARLRGARRARHRKIRAC